MVTPRLGLSWGLAGLGGLVALLAAAYVGVYVYTKGCDGCHAADLGGQVFADSDGQACLPAARGLNVGVHAAP